MWWGAASQKESLTILEYDDKFLEVEKSIVSEQGMIENEHPESWLQAAIFDSPTIESP